MRILIPLLALALTACATGGPGRDGITVETTAAGQPLAGANCAVQTNSGSWNVVTPGVVNVGATNGDLRVVCEKAGYRTSELLFQPVSRTGSSLGIGMGGGGGNVGVGVGLSFPLMSGATYPSRVTIDMRPQ
jgi:hypothetical protein